MDSNFNDDRTRSSHPEVFLGKGVLKICSKFTGEHPCRSVISATLLKSQFCSATLLKSYFGMGILLKIYCIFSEHHFLRTPLDGCVWSNVVNIFIRFLTLVYQDVQRKVINSERSTVSHSKNLVERRLWISKCG